jgi:predicted nuclease of predicted toxin-antitoxin system
MRLLADENIETPIVQWLRQAGHDVVWAVEALTSADDRALLNMASRAGRIVLTYDLDFGEMIYHEGAVATGLILLRFTSRNKWERLALLQPRWRDIEANMPGSFIVVMNDRLRIRPLQSLR